MIREVDRTQFLAAPAEQLPDAHLAFAVVVGDEIHEAAALDGWSALCVLLTGAGARIGYRSFLALLQDTESEVRDAITLFSEQRLDRGSWRFVAARLPSSAGALVTLKEIEWRAYKATHVQESPALTVVEVSHAL